MHNVEMSHYPVIIKKRKWRIKAAAASDPKHINDIAIAIYLERFHPGKTRSTDRSVVGFDLNSSLSF